MIFDTHAHYDDEAFEEDREALIASLAEQGIGRVVNVAAVPCFCIHEPDSRTTVSVYLRGGRRSSVQRGRADGAGLRMAGRKTGGSQSGCCREIGLDYYWDKEPGVQARQRESFSRQLQLAKKLDKPVIIHSRDAAKDTLDVMAAEGGSQLRAVIHCFSYTKETAREFQNGTTILASAAC